MTSPLLGAALGLLAGSGVVLAVWRSPPARRLSLADRLTPYLRDAPRPSTLLLDPTRPSTLEAAARLARPALLDAARLVERVLGGSRSVQRRLVASGSGQRVEDFRVDQVIWAAAGLLAGTAAAVLLAALSGAVSLLVVLLLAVLGGIGGVFGRDWWLSAQVRRREDRMLAELPVVAELLALAVTAGEAPTAALERVCRLARGELAVELGTALAAARSGVSLPVALQALSDRTSLDPLARFVDGVVIALERGTPLAEVLRAQAADAREAGKRALLATGGRREIAMMVPVVFLILPITVLFALYPGLVAITLLSR